MFSLLIFGEIQHTFPSKQVKLAPHWFDMHGPTDGEPSGHARIMSCQLKNYNTSVIAHLLGVMQHRFLSKQEKPAPHWPFMQGPADTDPSEQSFGQHNPFWHSLFPLHLGLEEVQIPAGRSIPFGQRLLTAVFTLPKFHQMVLYL